MSRLLRRIIWGNRRFLFIWTLIGLLALFGIFKKYCATNSSRFCNINQFGREFGGEFGREEALLVLGVAFILVFLPMLVSSLFYKRVKGSFTDDPHLYHGKAIVLEGVVVYILEDGIGEVLKRKATDAYRNMVGDPNAAGRYLHQRFLLVSPILRKDQAILVEHNTNYGKIPLKKGLRLRIQGEYLHPEKLMKGRRYGRIHFTHAPKGGIIVM